MYAPIYALSERLCSEIHIKTQNQMMKAAPDSPLIEMNKSGDLL